VTGAQAEAATLHDKVATRIHEAAKQILKLVLDGRTTNDE
jgi:hypothetical protein